MTEPKRALTDLRPVAEERLFRDWRVTPELKAQLQARIAAVSPEGASPEGAEPGGVEHGAAEPGQAPQRRAPRARSPWVWRGAVAVVAVCAVVGLIALGLKAPDGLDGGARGGAAANTVAESEQKSPYVYATPTGAQVPSAVQPPAAPAPMDGSVVAVTGAPKEALTATPADRPVTLTSSAYTITAVDANGNAVSPGQVTSAQVTSSQVLADKDATAAPPVPGVEAEPGRKIVLNAEFQLQVTDAVSAMQRLQQLAAIGTGYVVDAALNKGDDGSWAGRLTLRIPAGAYNGTIQDVRRLGEVKQERQWSQDVTDRYSDLQSRIAIQQAYEQKLQELAAKAATFDDWMKLSQQINQTQAGIEQMQGSLKLLANQVEYSTINITFTQPAPGKEPPKPQEPAKGLGPSMGRAFSGSVAWFAHLGEALLVGLAAVAPFAVAFLSVAGLLLIGWRRWRRSRSA